MEKETDKRQSISVPTVARSLLASPVLTKQDRLLIIATLAAECGFLPTSDIPKPTGNVPQFLCDAISVEVRRMVKNSEARQERRMKKRGQSADSPPNVQTTESGQSADCPRTVPAHNGNGNGNGNGINPPRGTPLGMGEAQNAFNVFFEAYPRSRRYGVDDAQKAWHALNEQGLLPAPEVVMAGLERWKKSELWRRPSANIPKPVFFIRDRQWEADPGAGVAEEAPKAAADPSLPFAPTPADLEDPEKRLLFLRSPAWRERVVTWCGLNAQDEWLADALRGEGEVAHG